MSDVVLNKIQTIERCLRRIREEYIGEKHLVDFEKFVEEIFSAYLEKQ